MSSRALRRLQRERDTELCSVSQLPETKGDDSDVTYDAKKPETADSVDNDSSINRKTSSAPTNLFDLVISSVCVCVCVLVSTLFEVSKIIATFKPVLPESPVARHG